MTNTDKVTYYEMIEIVTKNINRQIKTIIEDMAHNMHYRPIIFVHKNGDYINFSLNMDVQVDAFVRAIIIAAANESEKYMVANIDYKKAILDKKQIVKICGKKITVEEALKNLIKNGMFITAVVDGSFVNIGMYLK